MADDQWFIRLGSDKIGPLLQSELKQLAKDGTIGPDTLVSKDRETWFAARKIRNLLISKTGPGSVTYASQRPSGPQSERPATVRGKVPSATPRQARPDRWFLSTAEGEKYGPVTKRELDQWVAEGRVAADSQVLRDGDSQWRWAHDIFPGLSPFPVPGQRH